MGRPGQTVATDDDLVPVCWVRLCEKPSEYDSPGELCHRHWILWFRHLLDKREEKRLVVYRQETLADGRSEAE